MEQKAWKIFEDDNGPRFIMHGLNGTKRIKLDIVLTAKLARVRDGSGKRWYQSGFHVYRTRELLKSFIKSLSIFKNRYAVQVYVSELIPKHERSRASLSTKIMLSSEDWDKRIPIKDF